MTVQRYDPGFGPDVEGMVWDDTGDWVLYSDYQKLESEIKQLRDDLNKIDNKLKNK